MTPPRPPSPFAAPPPPLLSPDQALRLLVAEGYPLEDALAVIDSFVETAPSGVDAETMFGPMDLRTLREQLDATARLPLGAHDPLNEPTHRELLIALLDRETERQWDLAGSVYPPRDSYLHTHMAETAETLSEHFAGWGERG